MVVIAKNQNKVMNSRLDSQRLKRTPLILTDWPRDQQHSGAIAICGLAGEMQAAGSP